MSTRSLAWKALVEATRAAGFSLPRCAACGHRFYPPQRHCPACLHGHVEHAPDSGRAQVLSAVALHHTFDRQRFSELPVHVLAVRTESGVTLFALAAAPLAVGSAVVLELAVDAAHPQGVIRARGQGE